MVHSIEGDTALPRHFFDNNLSKDCLRLSPSRPKIESSREKVNISRLSTSVKIDRCTYERWDAGRSPEEHHMMDMRQPLTRQDLIPAASVAEPQNGFDARWLNLGMGMDQTGWLVVQSVPEWTSIEPRSCIWAVLFPYSQQLHGTTLAVQQSSSKTCSRDAGCLLYRVWTRVDGHKRCGARLLYRRNMPLGCAECGAHPSFRKPLADSLRCQDAIRRGIFIFPTIRCPSPSAGESNCGGKEDHQGLGACPLTASRRVAQARQPPKTRTPVVGPCRVSRRDELQHHLLRGDMRSSNCPVAHKPNWELCLPQTGLSGAYSVQMTARAARGLSFVRGRQGRQDVIAKGMPFWGLNRKVSGYGHFSLPRIIMAIVIQPGTENKTLASGEIGPATTARALCWPAALRKELPVIETAVPVSNDARMGHAVVFITKPVMWSVPEQRWH
ncbi:hypothetical protein QBC40DRAFT_293038 [Triangularia verruculosa]|uniref:Uncharacterized protein n=1 Tax=Triangularia verruculosa TaxID=2587418 RepID=A0AAN7AZK0_9PEZI|nr:hypothetical protein QBC40DRAFT_293038 [Triangularia verruculosa]